MADDIVTRLQEEIEYSVKADPQVLRDAITEIERLRAELDDVWAIANALATRIENISSGNAAALQAYDNALQEARRG